MLPLVIMGRAFSFLSSPHINLEGRDVWAFNLGATRYPVTAAFQMHQPPYVHPDEIENHNKWLKSLTIPVYMRERHEEFPTSVAYPFEDAFKLTSSIVQGTGKTSPIKYFTSSVAYAIALAILQERSEIYIYGIELEDRTEYACQRECYLFWVGFAGGRGISLSIYCGNKIFKKPLYGETWESVPLPKID